MEPTRIMGLDDEESGIVDALPEGTVLSHGNFIITQPLGQGGFGITYLARDETLERDVVIKECFPEALCHREGLNLAVRKESHEPHFRKCVEMFMREARSIAKLSHPNIVNVHAIFEQNETAYMVLDLVDGSDLLTIIEEQTLTFEPAQVQDLAIKTLEALSVVHGQNLLHRDISPDNILVDKWGQPTLIDFGSAREFASERTRYKTAMLFVKDGYSPFEFYVSGAAHSPSSDLYALGGTIYHLVTGNAPPSSQTRHADIQAGNPDPYVSPVGRFPGYETAFLESIDKAMELQPGQRFQSAKKWLDVIAPFKSTQSEINVAPRQPVPEELSRIITDTNKYVLQEAPAQQPAPEPAPVESAPVEATSQPKWRDEFNQETEEILAQRKAAAEAEARAQAEQAALEAAQNKRTALTVIRGWFARKPAPETATDDEEDLEALMLEAYLQNKAARKRQRSDGIGFAPVMYLSLAAFGVVFATLLAVNYDRMQEDGSWTVMFSLQGFCRNENAWTPVAVDCSDRIEARRLDLDSRRMILQMHDNDHIGR